MKRLVLPLLTMALAFAQDATNFPTIGEIIRDDPRLDKLIPKASRIEVDVAPLRNSD